MTTADVDAYLANVPEPKRATLEAVRAMLADLLPGAEQCISYTMPAFRVDGKVIAGFAAFTNHLAYLPHSGSVIPALADDLAGYTYTHGSLHFAVDEPLPRPLVEKLVSTRLAQLG